MYLLNLVIKPLKTIFLINWIAEVLEWNHKPWENLNGHIPNIHENKMYFSNINQEITRQSLCFLLLVENQIELPIYKLNENVIISCKFKKENPKIIILFTISKTFTFDWKLLCLLSSISNSKVENETSKLPFQNICQLVFCLHCYFITTFLSITFCFKIFNNNKKKKQTTNNNLSYWRAKLDAVLKCAHKVRVGELDDVQVVCLLHVLDPLVGLTLGVDHQGPPPRIAAHICR